MNQTAAHELLNLFITKIYAPWKAKGWPQHVLKNGYDWADSSKKLFGKRSKWSLLGSGCYGAAFAHRDYPDVVVKVDTLKEDGDDMNRGWPQYIQIANKSRSKHAVKVFALSDCGAMAVIERLDPVVGTYSTAFASLTPDAQTIRKTLGNSVEYGGIIRCKGLPQTFRNFMHTLKREAPETDWDLHGGNIMLRKDGTVVVTDPFT